MTRIERIKTDFDIPEIKSKLSAKIYQLSDYQLKRVEKAHQEWLDGELISSKDLHKEFGEWLDLH